MEKHCFRFFKLHLVSSPRHAFTSRVYVLRKPFMRAGGLADLLNKQERY